MLYLACFVAICKIGVQDYVLLHRGRGNSAKILLGTNIGKIGKLMIAKIWNSDPPKITAMRFFFDRSNLIYEKLFILSQLLAFQS